MKQFLTLNISEQRIIKKNSGICFCDKGLSFILKNQDKKIHLKYEKHFSVPFSQTLRLKCSPITFSFRLLVLLHVLLQVQFLTEPSCSIQIPFLTPCQCFYCTTCFHTCLLFISIASYRSTFCSITAQIHHFRGELTDSLNNYKWEFICSRTKH